MRNYILIGVLAFLAFAVVLMPASVARLAANRVEGLAMRAVGGTLWDGQANLAYRGAGIGTLEWTFMPLGVLDGEVRVRWRLSDADLDLSGTAAQGLSHALLSASGHVGAAAVNRVLGRYDIAIDGDFEATDVALVSDASVRASGALAWSGGRTFYRLSGQNYDTAMPAMIAEIRTVDGEHTLDAKLADISAAPLIQARLKSSGWIEIGLTRRFTTLAGNPWPVPGDDDAVVLTVEEQLFP
ncbi:MAG: type II secretion system protein N [Gammaproteobacteria bacterium]|nr:type II secretion system protein N [Gammaproteobacteria bacterium]